MEKPKSIFILVNTLDSVKAKPYGNHMNFAFSTGKYYPEYQIHFWNPERMNIDTARNQAAILAMQYRCDYLLFLDDDVLVPKDALKKAIDADKDVVCGLVCIRGYPFNVMAFKWVDEVNRKSLTYYNDFEKDLTPGSEIVPVAAVGFSFCLIKTDVLKALEPPYFLTGKDHTEDVYFCMKVQNTLEPVPGIYMHTGIRCGHLLNAEPIEYDTRAGFEKFYRDAYQEYIFKRTPEYLASCIEAAENSDKAREANLAEAIKNAQA